MIVDDFVFFIRLYEIFIEGIHFNCIKGFKNLNEGMWFTYNNGIYEFRGDYQNGIGNFRLIDYLIEDKEKLILGWKSERTGNVVYV